MNEMKCDHCQKDVSWKMAQVTMNRYRKVLCVKGQEEEINRTYPENLRESTIKRLHESLKSTF